MLNRCVCVHLDFCVEVILCPCWKLEQIVSTELVPAADAALHASLVTLFTFYLTISTRQRELYYGEHQVM